jgi:hypothetical protein
VPAASDGVASGVVQYALFSIAPPFALWLALHSAPTVRRVLRAVGRLRPVAPPPVEVAGPPLEQIAADIRRIAAGIERLPTNAPIARRRAALLAYDDSLAAACRALGIEQRLTALSMGPARQAERLRLECELQYEGFMTGSPRSG